MILKRLGYIKRDVQNNKKLIRKEDSSKATPAWVDKILEDEVKFKILTEANKILEDNECFELNIYGEKVAYDDSLISLNSVETEYNKVRCFFNDTIKRFFILTYTFTVKFILNFTLSFFQPGDVFFI